MKQTPHGSFAHIKESLIQYLETQYKIANSVIFDERGKILREGDKVAQVPFIEATPNFVANNFLRDLEVRHETIATGLSDLVQHGVAVDRHKIYTHQEEALLASFGRQPNLLVATGTGSGKTEAFLLPILSKLINESRGWSPPDNTDLISRYDQRRETWLASRRAENRPAAIRSIILYPMNALVNDQLTRLRRILSLGESPNWQRSNLNGNLVHFGMYTSLTPLAGSWNEAWRREKVERFLAEIQRDWDNLPASYRELGTWPRPDSAEMLTRWDMQSYPPDILVTNYSMLEYMLMRPVESTMFDQTREWLQNDPSAHFTLVLDEAHTYSGAKGTEVAHLIRRLKERLGLSASRKFQAIATTASVPPTADNQLKEFTSALFGEPEASWTLIRAGVAPSKPDTRDADRIALAAFSLFQRDFELQSPRLAIQRLAGAYQIADIDFSNGDEAALYSLIRDNPFIEWVRSKTARNATP
ncbi:DEAD/DEAH box helicase [Puia sp. P3]|uniref:DEAD/DEAH box helicase n=1 Tax=Puia sp. P3 TaxID=3423952 RepID=UPI003D675E76